MALGPGPLALSVGGAPLVDGLREASLEGLDDGTFALGLVASPSSFPMQVYAQVLDGVEPVGEAIPLAPGVGANQANLRTSAEAQRLVVAWEEPVDLATPVVAAVATVDGGAISVERWEGMEPHVAAAGADVLRIWRTNTPPYVNYAASGGAAVRLGDPAAPYATGPSVTAGGSRHLLTWRDTFGWEDDSERIAWVDLTGLVLAEEELHPRGSPRSLRGEPLHVGADTFLVVVEEAGARPTVWARYLVAP